MASVMTMTAPVSAPLSLTPLEPYQDKAIGHDSGYSPQPTQNDAQDSTTKAEIAMAMFSFISQLPGINVGPRMPTFGPMPDKQSPNELFGTLKEGGQLESQPYTGSLEGGYQQKNHCISLSRNWFERQTFGETNMKLRQGDWKSYDEESRDFLDLVHTVRPDAMLLRLDSGRHETGYHNLLYNGLATEEEVRGMLQDTDLTEDGKNNLVAISTALKALYDAGKPKAAHRFCSSLLRSLRTHDGVYSALYPDTKAIPMDLLNERKRLDSDMVNWRRPKDQVPEELLDSFEWPAGWSDRDTVIERLQEQVANGGLSMETNEEVGDRFKEAIDYMVSDKSGVIDAAYTAHQNIIQEGMSRLLGTQDYFNPKMTGTIGHETILVLPLHEEKSEETSKIPSADLGLSSMDTSEHVNDTQGSKPDLMEWSESPVDTMSTGSYPSGVGANTNLDSLLPDNAMAATAA